MLRAPDLGSLGPGAPVYYRRIQVGMVTTYKLDALGNYVDLEVFVDSPYDKYIDESTRFWNESGIDISVGADGVKVNTQSVASILAGGLAFASFGRSHEPIKPGEVFKLYDSHSAAKLEPEGVALPIVMRFYQPARGLKIGAPVDFAGMDIGIVSKVDLDYDIKTLKFFTRVEATLYPERLGPIYSEIVVNNRSPEQWAQSLVRMSMRGLRAELRTANLLTGQLFIVLEGQVLAEDIYSGQAFALLGQGEMFPLGALLAQRPVTNHYRADSDCMVLQLPLTAFVTLCQQSAAFQLFCTQRLANLLGVPLAP